MIRTVTRRAFGTMALAAGLSVGLWSAQPAMALTEQSAGALVQQVVEDINGVIASGKAETAMIDDFEAVFKKYADTSYVAAYAMGNEARRATPAQRSAFSDAFNTYVARKYGKQFREFIGGRLEVQDVTNRDRFYEVSTLAYLPGQQPFDVTFQISDRSGKDQFFNLFVEGVNMLLTERRQIGAILDANRGDIDAMIQDLRNTD